MVPSEEKDTGAEVARYIKNNYENHNKLLIIVHSFNEFGRLYIDSLGIPLTYLIPGAWMEDIFKTAYMTMLTHTAFKGIK